MKRVFQSNVNKPTEELTEQILKDLMGNPENKTLIDNYRQLKHRMAEAEVKQALDEFVSEITATEDYKKWLAAERKKDERRSKKLVPESDPKRVKMFITQLKSSLPAVIPAIEHFLESTDRWGRKDMWRVQATGYLSGLATLDVDHVPNPEERIQEWLAREDFEQLGIVWIFITPSGEGIKVTFKAREEWGNLQDNVYSMAELLGVLDYADELTKNSDHAHFIPKDSDVKYMDWETFFTYENPAYEARFGEAYRRGESEPTQARWQEYEKQRRQARKASGKTQTDSTAAAPVTTQETPVPAETPATTLTDYQQKCVGALNGYYGSRLGEGQKHPTFTQQTSHWLCWLADNDPQAATAMAYQLDYVKDWQPQPNEVEDLIQSAATKKLLKRTPKELQQILEKAGIDITPPKVIAGKDANPVSDLPFERWCDTIESNFDVFPCLREVCEPHPRRLWPFLLFASAAMMGTDMDLCYYYFYASESERTRLNYIIWGVGDPTSGKHSLERLMNLLLAPIIAEGEIADESTNTWKESTDAKGANKEKDLRPAIFNRLFGYRSSNSEFIRSMINCKEEVDGEMMGRHMVTVSSEKDLEIGKSGSWISRSNMLLLSFHGEYDDQHYSNKQSVSGRYRVFWNMVETFTPPTLSKLVNERSVNSGLDTRTATIPMGEDDFTMMPLRRKEDSKTAEYNETLRMWANRLDQRRGELPIWPLVEHVHQWCDDRRAIAKFNDKDKADWLLIKRVPYYGISISAPYIDMRHWEEREQTGTYTIDEKDLALCDLVLDIQYRTQIFWYYDLHRKYYDDQLREAAQQRRRTNKYMECFRKLPEEFDINKFTEVFGLANNHSAQKPLERLMKDKAIERTMRSNYRKLVSEL